MKCGLGTTKLTPRHFGCPPTSTRCCCAWHHGFTKNASSHKHESVHCSACQNPAWPSFPLLGKACHPSFFRPGPASLLYIIATCRTPEIQKDALARAARLQVRDAKEWNTAIFYASLFQKPPPYTDIPGCPCRTADAQRLSPEYVDDTYHEPPGQPITTIRWSLTSYAMHQGERNGMASMLSYLPGPEAFSGPPQPEPEHQVYPAPGP